MWFRRKDRSDESAARRGPFEGVGVYLTTEVHSVKSRSVFDPAALVHVQSEILGYQQRIIEEECGSLEQFVGDCVAAYWPPSGLKHIVRQADRAVHRIVREKPAVAGLEYRLSIRFCASDLAGAFFGAGTAFRFQVIGRARSRAEALPRSIPGEDCAFTDRDTFSVMPAEVRTSYVSHGSTAFMRKRFHDGPNKGTRANVPRGDAS